jgi:glyoxylase-like metal-dependent hydrolase (beta-lactamase superfamily II)
MHPALQPNDVRLVRARTTLGEFELTVCTDGTFLLDGGAMFGVVPKTLWSKRMLPDADNRVLLGLNSVIVRTGTETIVIETGLGNKLTPKQAEQMQHQPLLPQSLAAAGVDPAQVSIVINSHLHWDHCSWNTTLNADGSVTPTFPNARYFAHAGEVAHGRLQLERDRISYVADNYEPLIASGQMTLLTNDSIAKDPTIFSSSSGRIGVECFPGHTAQLMAVHIESAGCHACYISDLIPTAHHLDVTWAMGYDLDPVRVIAERKRFYARAIPEQWLVLFTHDHHTPMARIALNDKGKPVVAAQE